jgi:hypothetical protein
MLVSSMPVHGEVSSIQHYVVKFVSYMRQVFFSGYSCSSYFPKLILDLTEIILKVAQVPEDITRPAVSASELTGFIT